MKIIREVARYFVGALFIFSGLIKINDPIGTAIKLEEYFDSVREIEKQIEKLNHYYSTHEKTNLEEPVEGPMTRGEYIRLMGKLLVVAFLWFLSCVCAGGVSCLEAEVCYD